MNFQIDPSQTRCIVQVEVCVLFCTFNNCEVLPVLFIIFEEIVFSNLASCTENTTHRTLPYGGQKVTICFSAVRIADKQIFRFLT